MTAGYVRGIIGDAVCGTFFMQEKSCRQDCDLFFSGEADFVEKAQGFDTIIGDISLKRALADFKGEWFDLPHFAVSGRLW